MLSSRYCFVVGVILLAGCGGRAKVVTLPAPVPARMGSAEEGMASWYGNPYHGRRTSNGEIYDMDQLTAAHLSLPFDTWVQVTNLENGRTVDVRINDRGPFLKNRVIDLSRAAARAIWMIGPGTARVRVEVVGVPGRPYEPEGGQQVAQAVAPTQVLYSPSGTPLAVGDSSVSSEMAAAAVGAGGCPGGPFFAVQVGSFHEIENAERMRGKMQELYGIARLIEVDNSQGALYRVVVGQASDGAAAQRLLEHLSHDRFDGYVLRVDAASQCL
jgi:peptidoglycan lytic transglycosylase